ncbi:hypothetical protein GX51_00734 [Blastomyces parvus]|uniref:Uncharacterized protein n=1 Tax=Blastomyces parvus TaxID=2060905 RepID=A0A2B7XKW4_9EURO|nr:hypothetical protein GX51_00734 [Blastomyces parvus]
MSFQACQDAWPMVEKVSAQPKTTAHGEMTMSQACSEMMILWENAIPGGCFPSDAYDVKIILRNEEEQVASAACGGALLKVAIKAFPATGPHPTANRLGRNGLQPKRPAWPYSRDQPSPVRDSHE